MSTSKILWPRTGDVVPCVYGALHAKKIGSCVMLYTIGNGVVLPQSDIIPEGYRPSSRLRVPVASQNNSEVMWASIESDGSIELYKAGNEITTPTNFCFFEAVYSTT